MAYPNTQSLIKGHAASGEVKSNAINSTLSTQIIIKVAGAAVGAIQKLDVRQTRPLQEIQELGTDGIVEIVPSGATKFDLSVDRIVFDQVRLPEAFSRGFRFINAQRLPFDIMVLDFSNNNEPNSELESAGHVAMTFVNCWFASYSTPYDAGNYLITERAEIKCETAYISSPTASESGENSIPNGGGLRAIQPETDSAGIEKSANYGDRRGSMDASGLIKSIFS